MNIFTEMCIVLYLNEDCHHIATGELTALITNRQYDVDPTLVVCAEHHGTARNKPPQVTHIDQIGVSDFDNMIEPHTGTLECRCEWFIILPRNCS